MQNFAKSDIVHPLCKKNRISFAEANNAKAKLQTGESFFVKNYKQREL